MFDASYSFNESVRFSICAKKSSNLLHFRKIACKNLGKITHILRKLTMLTFSLQLFTKKAKLFSNMWNTGTILAKIFDDMIFCQILTKYFFGDNRRENMCKKSKCTRQLKSCAVFQNLIYFREIFAETESKLIFAKCSENNKCFWLVLRKCSQKFTKVCKNSRIVVKFRIFWDNGKNVFVLI